MKRFLSVVISVLALVYGCEKEPKATTGLVGDWELVSVDSCWGYFVADSLIVPKGIPILNETGIIHLYKDSTALFDLSTRLTCGLKDFSWKHNDSNNQFILNCPNYQCPIPVYIDSLSTETLNFYYYTCNGASHVGANPFYLFKTRRIK
jgi:hypothetical protein